MSWSWELRNFLGDQIWDPLPAWVSSLLLTIFFNETAFIIKSRSWGLLSLLKVSFSRLFSNSASGISWCSKVCSWCGHIVIGSWSFLSFRKIFPVWSANNYSIFMNEVWLGIVVCRCWFEVIVIKYYFVSWFASFAQTKNWWLVKNFSSFYIVVLRAWSMFIEIDNFLAHRSLLSFLGKQTNTVIYDLA